MIWLIGLVGLVGLVGCSGATLGSEGADPTKAVDAGEVDTPAPPEAGQPVSGVEQPDAGEPAQSSPGQIVVVPVRPQSSVDSDEVDDLVKQPDAGEPAQSSPGQIVVVPVRPQSSVDSGKLDDIVEPAGQSPDAGALYASTPVECVDVIPDPFPGRPDPDCGSYAQGTCDELILKLGACAWRLQGAVPCVVVEACDADPCSIARARFCAANNYPECPTMLDCTEVVCSQPGDIIEGVEVDSYRCACADDASSAIGALDAAGLAAVQASLEAARSCR